MQNIHIVHPNSGWILTKISERVAANNKNTNYKFTTGTTPINDGATVNYYVDIQNCWGTVNTYLDIGFFTHADMNSQQWLHNLIYSRGKLDGIVSMNKRYTDMLQAIGVPENKLVTIVPGDVKDTFPMKKIRIACVTRFGYIGQGTQMMINLIYNYDLSNFEFYLLGNGCDSILEAARAKGAAFFLS